MGVYSLAPGSMLCQECKTCPIGSRQVAEERTVRQHDAICFAFVAVTESDFTGRFILHAAPVQKDLVIKGGSSPSSRGAMLDESAPQRCWNKLSGRWEYRLKRPLKKLKLVCNLADCYHARKHDDRSVAAVHDRAMITDTCKQAHEERSSACNCHAPSFTAWGLHNLEEWLARLAYIKPHLV